MNYLCTDNRFELIKKYKQKLIECTNIESTPEEMAVLDNILFRFWQMKWLDKLELPFAQSERKKGHWVGIDDFPHDTWECDGCGYVVENDNRIEDWNFCPNCGADKRGEKK